MNLATLNTGMDTVWVVLTAAMIILMEGGFALLEAGFVRLKNSVSIIMKVFVDIALGALCYYMVGFALMFGKDAFGLVGNTGFLLTGDLSHLKMTISHETYFLFQAAFAIAAISIVSGAVAERINFRAYILYAMVMTAFLYPVSGHWVWGNGWLGSLGMEDFAGSAAIHALGGFSALAAAKFIGPRLHKYDADGKGTVIVPSNLPLASVGAFLLWFGWFGFNAGSTLSATDPRIGHIALTTMLAASASGSIALFYTLFRYQKADAPSVINGSLAGLVAITAGCAYVNEGAAIFIGALAGLLMIWFTDLMEVWKIDDPVGAFPVHGISGVVGTLAVGVFDTQHGLLYGGGWHLLAVQTLGLVMIAIWGFIITWGSFSLMSRFIAVRVSPEEEEVGLDISAHGIMATHDSDFIMIHESPILEKGSVL